MMPTILSLGFVASGAVMFFYTARLERMVRSGKAAPDPWVPPKTLRLASYAMIIGGVLMFIAQHFVALEF